MKTSILYVLSFSAWSIAIPTQSERELDTLFARAVGDSCKANEGTGSCQNTANCKGISYPTGLCPKDPADIQVKKPYARLLLCKHDADYDSL